MGIEVITVDRLFLVSRQFTLGDRKLLARALSAADLRVQQTQASLAGLRMREALDDHTSEEYAVRVKAGLAFGTDEQLRNWIDLGHVAELEAKAYSEHPLTFDPFPDGAGEEERQLVLAKRQATAKAVGEARAKVITDGMAAWQAKTLAMSRAELETTYTSSTIKNAIDTAWRRAFENASLLAGVRSLDGQPYFESLAEIEQVPDSVREVLLAEVRSVNDIDPLHWSLPSSTDSAVVLGASSAVEAALSGLAQP